MSSGRNIYVPDESNKNNVKAIKNNKGNLLFIFGMVIVVILSCISINICMEHNIIFFSVSDEVKHFDQNGKFIDDNVISRNNISLIEDDLNCINICKSINDCKFSSLCFIKDNELFCDINKIKPDCKNNAIKCDSLNSKIDNKYNCVCDYGKRLKYDCFIFNNLTNPIYCNINKNSSDELTINNNFGYKCIKYKNSDYKENKYCCLYSNNYRNLIN
jgi:hypothetical protein